MCVYKWIHSTFPAFPARGHRLGGGPGEGVPQVVGPGGKERGGGPDVEQLVPVAEAAGHVGRPGQGGAVGGTARVGWGDFQKNVLCSMFAYIKYI